MNSTIKTLISYAIAIIMGIGIFLTTHAYALTYRADSALYGGELLLIFVPAGILFVIRCIRKDKDIFRKDK